MDNERKIPFNGLPPLPKSLSAAVPSTATTSSATRSSSSTASPLNNHLLNPEDDLYLGPSTSAAARNRYRHGSLSSTQESLSDRESIHSRASSSHSSHHTPTNALSAASSSSNSSTLDAQLAILRREMYSLRQMDLSLLSQLWALNESIQGFRIFLQEQEALSPPSPSPTPSDNSITSEPEDESFSVPPKLVQPAISNMLPGGSVTSSASGTSGSSSATSSMGKQPGPIPPAPQKTHPQLPRILQQRMRRAPPPPPPTRPKAENNMTPVKQRAV